MTSNQKVALLTALILGVTSWAGLATRSAEGAPARTSPVVVELFTSQGCSSCPPADRLLTRLGSEKLPRGIEVIPLSFHVDYWNYIGWTDPFSSKEWSERQRRYAQTMGLRSLYTPQAVVQGSADINGTDADSMMRAIGGAAERGSAVEIGIELALLTAETLEVKLASQVVDALPAGKIDMMVALFEKSLVTPVARGENASRTLENDYVVRVLRQGFDVGGRQGTERSGSVAFEIDPSWQQENLGVAAFVQDRATLQIFGGAAANLAASR